VFELVFPARADALVAARQGFAQWLVSDPVDDDAQFELSVVFSELAMNAVDGSPGVTDEVAARAWWDGADLVLEIVNATDGFSDTGRWDLDDPLRAGGRGLMIVRELMDDLEIARRDGHRLAVRGRRRMAGR